MIQELLVYAHEHSQDAECRSRLLVAILADPSRMEAELPALLQDQRPSTASFVCSIFADCTDIAIEYANADMNKLIWYLSVLNTFVGEITRHCSEELWLISNELFCLLSKFIACRSVFAMSTETIVLISEMCIGLFRSNLYRVRCLETLRALCDWYWNQPLYEYLLQEIFEFYPLLDYRQELHKLELIGMHEAQVFQQTMLALIGMLQLGASRVADCSFVLGLAIRICSLESVYLGFVSILAKSVTKLAYAPNANLLMGASVEVLVSQIPQDASQEAQTLIAEAILTVFSCCQQIVLQVCQQRLREVFKIEDGDTRNSMIKSFSQSVCILAERLGHEHDLWFFRWVHLLQNYCETLKKADKAQVVECVLNVLGCNMPALKRYPNSIKMLNGLLQKHLTLGWRTILQLGRQHLLSQQTAEEIYASIRRFDQRNIRKALWEVIIGQLKVQHYDDIFDYDIVNYIGIRHVPGWEINACKLMQVLQSQEDAPSEELQLVVKHAEHSFAL